MGHGVVDPKFEGINWELKQCVCDCDSPLVANKKSVMPFFYNMLLYLARR